MSSKGIEVACLRAISIPSVKDKEGTREEKNTEALGQKEWLGHFEELTFKWRPEEPRNRPCELEGNRRFSHMKSCG